ncbi:MAG: hypothetical protein PHH93_11495 [Prolixibacteraceae bacterium]|nr:hypothetical protein [Prolixibacteraceae bacterium]
MSERFTSDLIFILVVLLVAAALGFLIGYLIRRYRHLRCSQVEEELTLLKEWKKIAEEEHGQLKNRCTGAEAEINTLRSDFESYKSLEEQAFSAFGEMPELVFDAEVAAGALGYRFDRDDLKVVEGIGEKIESILKSRGIDSWWKLSRTDPDRIKEILLDVGGPRYSMHEPRTWPRQSMLAFQGRWGELKEYQDDLNAGR